ncbi:DCP2-domain-containing protein [Tilletiaria anomala UBC 951]|uniref:DCP2-domain-containing protein n=1 Tax=Tilletiaria anomala (strain ATCC 24038 / CBS 436.72 / UBC 951) TaxID=1037660 RepID=A0A066WPZ0_TILAU|nr:DCP2-domain-containing protein [Tilletiaria anomala UBC 951]KDN53074.1 DCP2-domain-containing protein [Tilletiaria anomala UBC 951]
MADLSFAETLEDLSSRFIVNLPAEELSSIERICFQCEQAHWFYEDFLRPLNPSLPSLKLRKFSIYLLHTSSLTVPLIRQHISGHKGEHDLEGAFDNFLKYKSRVPVCGAILITAKWDKCLLVRGWKSTSWGFPKGKINQGESERDCAVREVFEETGYDCGALLESDSPDFLELAMREQKIRLYVVPGVAEDFEFKTQTRKEISKIQWFKLTDLPTWKSSGAHGGGVSSSKFYLISPFVRGLKTWIQENKQKHPRRPKGKHEERVVTEILQKGQKSSSLPPPAEMSHFPDAGSLFPTFTAEKQNANTGVLARNGPLPTQQHASASAPSQDGDASDMLKSILGLGAIPAVTESAVRIPLRKDHPATPGVGAHMIEAQGIPRGRQLLELLRGAVPQASDSPSAVANRPHAHFQSAAAAEQEDGARALLAALHAGAGNAGPLSLPAQSNRSQEQQPQGRRQDADARHEFPPRLPQPADSPLLAPKAQKTTQAQALLKLISPTKVELDIPATAHSQVQLHTSSQASAHEASQCPAERERAAQRNLLLSQLIGSTVQQPAAPARASPPRQYGYPSQHHHQSTHSNQASPIGQSDDPSQGLQSHEQGLLSLLSSSSRLHQQPLSPQDLNDGQASIVHQAPPPQHPYPHHLYPQQQHTGSDTNPSQGLLAILQGRAAAGAHSPDPMHMPPPLQQQQHPLMPPSQPQRPDVLLAMLNGNGAGYSASGPGAHHPAPAPAARPEQNQQSDVRNHIQQAHAHNYLLLPGQ